MQPLPIRLFQVTRVAFQASKPIRRVPGPLIGHQHAQLPLCSPAQGRRRIELRFYSGGGKEKDTDSKVEDAKNRIAESIQSRVEHVTTEGSEPAQNTAGETIIHTHPEASSIVYSKSSPSETASRSSKTSSPPDTDPENPLPSTTSSRRTELSKRFAQLMDNLQSNIFIASRSINDLTGYSGIERIKVAIEQQESLVQSTRRAVKDLRTAYAAAISNRSATQREVNDLLHRKHNWTPVDLERFTSLYRSDHTNEQAEMAAQAELGAAESSYEEASTKLARTILARYHEEQIWSDKIRQMSTWGTWGLMGLNVLLFVVFQIAIEPWRRKRLVKGFEEKVQEALAQQNTAMTGDEVVAQIPDTHTQDVVETLAGSIVDAVSGAAPTDQTPPLESTAPVEADIENVTAHEISEGIDDLSFPNPSISQPAGYPIPDSSAGFAYYKAAFRELFSEKGVVVSQKELTTVALEGAVGGAAVMGLLLVLLRPK